MTIINNLSNTKHSDWFKSLSSKADELFIASPFCYPEFREFADSLYEVKSIEKVTFITTLRRDGVAGKIDSLISFRNEMDRIKVQWVLCLDECLHGKVYLFKKDGYPFAGIITSANLTRNGMESNHEWGCLIEDVQQLEELEKRILDDTDVALDSAQLDTIKSRTTEKLPQGVLKSPAIYINIDDIIHSLPVNKDTRIFVKPIGVSSNPVYKGDFSRETFLYFSKKYPRSVRVGDILIAYAVGGRKIIGAYRVTSSPLWDEDGDPRWPWYVESENLTPVLSNCIWAKMDMWVTGIANQYAKMYDKPVTHRGGKNLNSLNYGADKVWLDDEYGRYLLGRVMEVENTIKGEKKSE